MNEIDSYLNYLHEQSIGDRITGGIAKGLGKVQGVVGKGLMLANLANIGNLPPVAQGLTAMSAGTMGLNAYQRWKQKKAMQQQQQQMKQPNR